MTSAPLNQVCPVAARNDRNRAFDCFKTMNGPAHHELFCPNKNERFAFKQQRKAWLRLEQRSPEKSSG